MSGTFQVPDNTQQSRHTRPSVKAALDLIRGDVSGNLGLLENAFFLWLVAHDRCWTTDRLARRNLPHPELCALCDQEEETINHLLSSCVFAREFWFILLKRVSL
jgi:hypothetical protein